MAENLKEGGRPILVHVPDEIAFIRPDLQRFFDAMVYKLRRNKAKGRWEDLDLDKCLIRLRQEADELAGAIETGSTAEILMEAADVANYALICANIGLEAKDVQHERTDAVGGPKVVRSA